MTPENWRIEMLGELRVLHGGRDNVRFRTRKTAGILVYMALRLDRACPREELIALFWPDADIEAGRVSLRTALTALRRELEPQEAEIGSVLFADRQSVQLHSEMVTTDVADFDRLLKSSRVGEAAEQVKALRRAVALYRGDLLPGCYDEWAITERRRLSEAHLDALRRLVAAEEQEGNYARAIEYARRILQADTLDEAAHSSLIRLLLTCERPSDALRQYQEWERILREELAATPSPRFQSLLPRIRAALVSAVPTSQSLGVSALPPASLPDVPLPAPLAAFFGRREEIAQNLARLEQPETRLITLTGLGGSGKTRLAMEVARNVQKQGTRAIYFVPLADITDARLLGETLRNALHLDVSGRGDMLDSVSRALQARPAVLVLDNFEQLAETGVFPLRRLLQSCPLLTCLVTSRVRLGIEGEWEFPVSPLPIPLTPGTPERLMEFAGVQLFVHRAQAIRPDFQITSANAQDIAQLCRALEGLPLALELAAAQLPALTPAQMLQHIARGFRFLAARNRDVAARHRTLRAALDWSFQSLPEPLQLFCARLAVFRGGLNPSAVEAVCDEPDALNCLLQLRDSSLLVSEEQQSAMRFRMLETVRAYCEEQLTEFGEIERMRTRHAAFFCRLAQEAEQYQNRREEAVWMDRLEAEHDNLRAALDACRTLELRETTIQLLGALWKFWVVRGHIAEGRWHMEVLREPADVLPRTVHDAKALYGAGFLAWYQNDYEAAQHLTRESLALWRELNDAQGIARALHRLGAMSLFLQDYDTAAPLLDESLRFWQEVGDDLGRAETLARLAEVKRGHRDYVAARTLQQESLTLETKAGATWNMGYSLWGMGNIAFDEGNYAEAGDWYRKAIQAVRQLRDTSNLPFFMEPLGHVAAARGNMERAARLFSATSKLRETLGIPAQPEAASRIQARMQVARSQLGDTAFGTACTAGSALTIEQTIFLALEADSDTAEPQP